MVEMAHLRLQVSRFQSAVSRCRVACAGMGMGSMIGSFWDTQTNGQADSIGGPVRRKDVATPRFRW